MQSKIAIDSGTKNKINTIIHQQVIPTEEENRGRLIERVSAEFLGTPYVANMLVGSATTAEKLVIDFRGLDCFTYLDYVQALIQSNNIQQFTKNLINTRYIDGQVSFTHRKHFFTDWAYREPRNAVDITDKISPHSVTVIKHLNERADGGKFLVGIPVVTRQVTYIPKQFINDSVLKNLKTGDYIGIYTPIDGLDVTHVGIYIKTSHGPVLRNASSRIVNRKVVDSPFMEYVSHTPGIVVLRSLA